MRSQRSQEVYCYKGFPILSVPLLLSIDYCNNGYSINSNKVIGTKPPAIALFYSIYIRRTNILESLLFIALI